jgi:branched-chain amino acid transport system ATP-binding protein
LLKLENISAHYGDVQALRNVSFEIKEKQIVSLVGSNGAGKSTTLNTISGVLTCSSGTIEFIGRKIENLPPHQIVELGLVQIPEGRLLFPYMTVLENLELGSFPPKARKGKDENLKLVFGLFPVLRERMNQLAGTLSGGEQQMLAVGRGLMAIPKLLMLDEPSLGLAPLMLKTIFEAIEKINCTGTPILLVEQDVKRSLSLARRGYVMENGRITLQGKAQELLLNEHLKKAYLGI